MPTKARLPHLLVLRPYLSSASREGAYADVEALVMQTSDHSLPWKSAS